MPRNREKDLRKKKKQQMWKCEDVKNMYDVIVLRTSNRKLQTLQLYLIHLTFSSKAARFALADGMAITPI